jgi:putative membrane protein
MRFPAVVTSLIILFAMPALAQDRKAATEIAISDRNFVLEAASGGMVEVALGKLAQKNGASDAVKTFGQHMVADHGKAGSELEAIAAKLGIDVPKAPGKKHEGTLKKFESLSGPRFDQAYAAQMVADHETTIALFEGQAKSGQSSDLKAFAARTLPTLKAHLGMARALPESTK